MSGKNITPGSLSRAQKAMLVAVKAGNAPGIRQGQTTNWLLDNGLIKKVRLPEHGLPECPYELTDLGKQFAD